MKKQHVLTLAIILLTVLCLVACSNTTSDLWATATYTEDTEVGTGTHEFALVVTAEDRSITLTVHTDAENLGAALLELGVIEGSDGAYGLYIDKVNGITASWENDSAWWCLMVNGETSMTGIDGVIIEDGANYELKYTK